MLAESLARYLPDVARDPAAVEARLAGAITDARTRWPAVTLDPAAYVAWIAARLQAKPPSLEHALDELRLVDLYLACACAAGNAPALAAFDAEYLARDRRSSDDAKQMLRQKLFVQLPGRPPPRIALYAGRGDLGRWVQAALARIAIDEARSAREVPTEDALMDAFGIDPQQGPEVANIKRDARATLQAAFRDAVATLSDRERTLLLQYYIDGVGLAELGKLLGLAPSNVSRTLAKIRLRLVAQIRRALMRTKKIPGEELDSLVELVQSQLSLTGGLRDG